jgi:hypothetical protein
MDSSLFDKPLTWKEAQAICAGSDCNGIVALEAFDSDGYTTITTSEHTEKVDGKDKVVTTYEATRETVIHASWRLYDIDKKQIADDLQEDVYTSVTSYEDATEDGARSGLPNDNETVHLAGYATGETYARRIAPNFITVTRTYYAKGHPELKSGKSLAKSDQWEQASAHWTDLFKATNDPKLKGKAAYNVALAAEVMGDLEAAKKWQGKAVRHLSKPRVVSYGAVLSGRIHDAARLQEADL